MKYFLLEWQITFLYFHDVVNIELYFRVRKPMQSCTIIIRSGETVIRKIQKQNIVPSEMEIVSIVTDAIEDELIVEGI